MLFYSHYLYFDPVILMYEPKNFVKQMYFKNKNELSRSKIAKVIVCRTERETYRQTLLSHYASGQLMFSCSHCFVCYSISGADTPLYLALLPADVSSPRGAFVSERKIVEM